jgi:hypothetical protein
MNENLRQRPLLSNSRHLFLDVEATAAMELLFEAPNGTSAAKTLTAIVDRCEESMMYMICGLDLMMI